MALDPLSRQLHGVWVARSNISRRSCLNLMADYCLVGPVLSYNTRRGGIYAYLSLKSVYSTSTAFKDVLFPKNVIF